MTSGASRSGSGGTLDAGARRLATAYEREFGPLPPEATKAIAAATGTVGEAQLQRILDAAASVNAGGTPAVTHGGGGLLGQIVDARKASPTITPLTSPSVAETKSVTPMSALAEQTKTWDATTTAARIASGEVSAVEVTRAAIERAEASQPLVNAIVHPMYAEAIARAKRGGTGCFAGVPTFVKDMEDVAGAPTNFGTSAMRSPVRDGTAASVEQFLTTGAITLGKSASAEFGLLPTTEPVNGEPTRNPVNRDHSPGGSSGGAAALVGAGVVPIAHGGDGGGSIRIPASFCGLVGLKATRGRLAPMASSSRMPVKIATYGVLTRSVRDTATFFEATDVAPIKGMAPIGKVEGPPKERLRIGLFVDPPSGSAVDPEVRAAVMATAHELVSQGHRVDFVPAPYDQQLVDDFLLHWGLMAAGVEEIIKRSPEGDVEKLEPWTRGMASMARKNWWRIPTAVLRLRGYHAKYAKVFDKCDVLLSPTAATTAPKLGHVRGDQPFEVLRERLLTTLPYTPVQNASGGPAISIPAGASTDGLPIGVQFASPWGQERRLIELAYALDKS